MTRLIPTQADTALRIRDRARVLIALIAAMGDAAILHVLRDGVVVLASAHNIPPSIAEAVATVPLGKGLAGLAAARRAPVSVCDLLTDESGLARPEARRTGMEASVAVPMRVNGERCGVFGVGPAAPHEWTASEQTVLLEIGVRRGVLVRS